MLDSLDDYRVNSEGLLTPALLIYPAKVDENIRATLSMAGGDANRWRPHVKTAKLSFVMKRLLDFGVRQFKCSTTLELLTLCRLGARDVLVAFPMVGANAARVREIAAEWPNTRISVLIEDRAQAEQWLDTPVGLFIDINPGMNRTGIGQERIADIENLAKLAGPQLAGIHFYDGQYGSSAARDRETGARAGYQLVSDLALRLIKNGMRVEEVITSGTPVAPIALSFGAFSHAPFTHRVSPGTVVYNDMSSLEQLSGFGYQPAVLVLSTVVSQPAPYVATCDAGHKAVSVDSGVPSCAVMGWPQLTAQKPSEEHLPLRSQETAAVPAIGETLYLLPRHVCPTVNNFDHAVMVNNGKVEAIELVTARGHEAPLPLQAAH